MALNATRMFLMSAMPPMLWSFGSLLLRRLLPSTTLLQYAPDGWNTQLPGGAVADDFWETFLPQERTACERLIARVNAGEPILHDDSDENEKYALFGYVLTLAARNRQTIKVLDYGGNLGDYYWLARALAPDLELEYHCKELPRVAQAGRGMTPDVIWHTDNACLEDAYDLVMFSSSIQCLPDWQDVLVRAGRAARDYLFLLDVATVRSVPSYVATHRSRKRVHLQMQLNHTEIIRTAEASGVRLLREFPMGPHPPIVNAPEQPICIGWLFERPRP